MDHLETSEDRKDRWYAKNISPRFIPIRSPTDTEWPKNDYGKEPSKCVPSISSSSVDDKKLMGGDSSGDGGYNGIPYKLLLSQPTVKAYMKTQLEQNGFVVITKALTLDECDHGLKLAWDYIEAASAAELQLGKPSMRTQYESNEEKVEAKENIPIDLSVRRNDPSTYSNHFPNTVEGGILPFYGSGHTSFMWYLRSLPSIQNIFASIYNTTKEEGLATSLDGMIAWLKSKSEPTDSGWFHIDQNPISKPGFESVQGLVNLLPVTSYTGGNVLVQKSHLLFPHHYVKNHTSEDKLKIPKLFYKKRLEEINLDDWLEIDPYDKELLDPSMVISCMLGPGDVLVWDSRLVHCSYPATKNVEGSNNERNNGNLLPSFSEQHGFIRCAGLINMMPRSKVSNETRHLRMEAIKSCRTLTHWVNKVAPLGAEKSEEVQKERSRVEFMKKKQGKSIPTKVLYDFMDLNKEQQRLV